MSKSPSDNQPPVRKVPKVPPYNAAEVGKGYADYLNENIQQTLNCLAFNIQFPYQLGAGDPSGGTNNSGTSTNSTSTNSAVVNGNVVTACQREYPTSWFDCSKFARAVAKDVGVQLSGDADDIYSIIQKSPWIRLANGQQAADAASKGWLVLAALYRPSAHGHVVVIVPGPVTNGNPTAWWGNLNGRGHQNTSITAAFSKSELNRIVYGGIQP